MKQNNVNFLKSFWLRHRKFAYFCFFTAVYFFSGVGLQNSGDTPQFALTKSIVENNSFYIDSAPSFAWPDIGIVDDHTVSGRSPGESFLAIPFFLFTKTFKKLLAPPYDGLRIGINFDSAVEASVTMVSAFFGSFSVLLVYAISSFLVKNKRVNVFVSALFGIGTLHWKYSSVFYRHSAHVFFLLLACFGLLKIIDKKEKKTSSVLLVGLASAGALFVDPASIVFLFFLYLFIFYRLAKGSRLSKDTFLLKSIILTFVLVLTINLPVFYYNHRLFGAFYKTGWESQIKNTWLGNFEVTFSTPILPSVVTNLFTFNSPIPQRTFSPHLINTKIGEEQSFFYASKYDYKGIFFQSPYLFLMFPSLFFLKKKEKKYFLLILFLAFMSCFLQFKYLVFYSPNSYDTRFFIPLVALLTPLISPTIDFICRSIKRVKFVAGSLVVALTAISIFNAWVSNVENYAPHLTGEKRVLAYSLYSPSINFNKIFSETFPNIFNSKIFFLYVFFFFGMYFLFSLWSRRRTRSKIRGFF